MPVNPFQTARFQISAAQLRQLPEDAGSEVAFAGRSNAGKSSALNAICAQSGLARTSKTPGRTQLLNVFVLDDGRRLIDLPGYGYAKVPTGMRDSWKKLIDAYLRERESLRGVVLIMDSRHPLKDFDRQMLTYCTGIELPCLLLLTKADKLSRSEGSKTLAAVRKECAAEGWTPHLQLFSAHAKTGVDEARTALDSLLNG
ncbi:MAG TPA: ribosome biogenesis GTP-binding protein YihA/YsxC [Rudaea sp.]|jgi:GTP-binding protein|nr:ribosome biogenesis GTP-binding protein YihA/YsxC [Rudaea sp.]